VCEKTTALVSFSIRIRIDGCTARKAMLPSMMSTAKLPGQSPVISFDGISIPSITHVIAMVRFIHSAKIWLIRDVRHSFDKRTNLSVFVSH